MTLAAWRLCLPLVWVVPVEQALGSVQALLEWSTVGLAAPARAYAWEDVSVATVGPVAMEICGHGELMKRSGSGLRMVVGVFRCFRRRDGITRETKRSDTPSAFDDTGSCGDGELAGV